MHRQTFGALFVLLGLLLTPEAWGADFYDLYVSMSGSDSNPCTEAAPCRHIQYAVNVASPGDTISIGKGTFVEAGGVGIDKDLVLLGDGIFSTRVTSWTGSVFKVGVGAIVGIAYLQITGGTGNAGKGGGIQNDGNLTLGKVWLRKNSAKWGGGIFNSGTLLINESDIALNTASISGGGLRNEGYAELREVRIVKNYAFSGGGIENTHASGLPAVITYQSEISHNSGNGINNWGNMALYNTTVSRNKQMGIFIGDEGSTDLIHVTVAENGGGGLYLRAESNNDVVLDNTIIANNAVTQCSLNGGSVGAAGSLISDSTCGSVWGGNLVGVDPKLGPLKYNGGSTFTHALKKGSPAIDAGDPGLCEEIDQRGVSRSIDGNGDGTANCDIGAFEYHKALKKPPLEQ